MKVNYDCVSEFAGHQTNKEVEMDQACDDIFGKVKQKAMQLAVAGRFMNFETLEELKATLEKATANNASIRIYDENIGG